LATDEKHQRCLNRKPTEGEPADVEQAQDEAEEPQQGGAAQGEAAQGEAAQGEAPQGEAPQGEAPQGEAPQGEAAQGEAAQEPVLQGQALEERKINNLRAMNGKPRSLDDQNKYDATFERLLRFFHPEDSAYIIFTKSIMQKLVMHPGHVDQLNDYRINMSCLAATGYIHDHRGAIVGGGNLNASDRELTMVGFFNKVESIKKDKELGPQFARCMEKVTRNPALPNYWMRILLKKFGVSAKDGQCACSGKTVTTDADKAMWCEIASQLRMFKLHYEPQPEPQANAQPQPAAAADKIADRVAIEKEERDFDGTINLNGLGEFAVKVVGKYNLTKKSKN